MPWAPPNEPMVHEGRCDDCPQCGAAGRRQTSPESQALLWQIDRLMTHHMERLVHQLGEIYGVRLHDESPKVAEQEWPLHLPVEPLQDALYQGRDELGAVVLPDRRTTPGAASTSRALVGTRASTKTEGTQSLPVQMTGSDMAGISTSMASMRARMMRGALKLRGAWKPAAHRSSSFETIGSSGPEFGHYDSDDRQKKISASSHPRSAETTEWRSIWFDSAEGMYSTRLSKFVESSFFESLVILLILVNSVTLGIEVDWEARHPGHDSPITFFVISSTLAVFFTCELALRICAKGRKFLFEEDWKWNYTDVVLVLGSATEAVMGAVSLMGVEHGRTDRISGIRIIRIIRITRVMRNVRSIKLLRFVASLRTLVSSIAATLKSLLWALLLLVMIIYSVAVILTQNATAHVRDVGVDDPLHEFWGDLFKSSFTLFKCISGGISWHDVVVPWQDVSFGMVALFTFYIFFTYFAVLNVITGVFCQSAIETVGQEPDLAAQSVLMSDRKYAAQLRHLFKRAANKSEHLQLRHLEKILSDELLSAYLAALGLEPSDAWSVFKLLDQDGSHSIDVDEFVAGILRLRGTAKSMDVERLLLDQRLLFDRVTDLLNRLKLQSPGRKVIASKS